MKTGILIVLSLLLLVLPALCGPPDDNHIVPGTRIGKWMFKMTIDDFMNVDGPASTRPV